MPRAGNAVVGALKVILAADSAQFEEGLKGAQRSLSGFVNKLKGPLVAISAAITAAAGGLTVAIKSVLNEADEMSKAAQKFGVPIEQLTALNYAADLAGVSFEGLGKSLQFLSKNMVTNADAFAQLGINVKDSAGNLRAPIDVLLELSDVFNKSKDGAGKTQTALTLLGKSGTELIPLLNGGADSIRNLMKEAEQLGIVIDQKTGTAAEQFNDNLTRLMTVMRGVWVQITAQVAPALADMSDRLVQVAKDGSLAKIAVEAFNSILKFGQRIIIQFNGFLQEMIIWGKAIALVFDTISKDGAVDLTKVVDIMRRARNDVRTLTTEIKADLASIDANGGAKNSRLNIFGDSETPPPPPATGTNDLSGIQTGTTQDDNPNKEMIPAGYADAVAEGNRQAKIMNEQLAVTQQLWDGIARTLEQGALNMLDQLINKTLTWQSALKNVLNIAISILTQIGQSAIASQGGWGQIITSSIPQFAQGGSFKVGGTGGIDSQLVAMRMTPGETGIVLPPGEELSPMGGYAPVNNISVGAGVSRAEVEMALNLRDQAIVKGFPVAMKSGRTRGKF